MATGNPQPHPASTVAEALELASAPVKSPMRIFTGRLLRNRPAMIGGVILLILYMMALFGSFIGPYDPNASHRRSPDHPPTSIHFIDEDGNFHVRPFVYRTNITNLLRRTYETDTSVRYPVRFLVEGEPYKLWWLFDCKMHLFGAGPPARIAGQMPPGGEPPRIHLLGTDRLGRDIFSRILDGAKISLSVGLIGIIIIMTLGMLIGGISGYFGGWVDTLVMRFTELMMSIPGLYLILALRAAFSESNPLRNALFGLKEGQSLDSGQMYILIIAILGLVSWGGTARVIRGMILSLRKLEYVQAARALGASTPRIIVRHLLPNTLTYVIIAATLSVPSFILGEVALSFLGVGIEEPQASWGNMLKDAQNVRALENFTWVLAPGFFIFITVFAFNFFGDGVRDALDPKHIE